MIAGTEKQQQDFFAPFLATSGAPLAGFASSEPGGSANFACAPPGEGVRTRARADASHWVIDGAKQWVSSASGWDGKGADLLCVVCRTDPQAPAERGLSVIAVPKPVSGFVQEHVFESMGHRGHLTPRFRLEGVRVPAANLIGPLGGGKAIVDASFSGTAALVGIMAVGIMRSAFDFALKFAKSEKRGGTVPIIDHQAVGYALVDAKASIEAARNLALRACYAQDAQLPGALELSLYAKVFGSETAVKVITDLMRVVGIESYDTERPLAGLLQDALALPIFDGGNMGIRRRQLHELVRLSDYDPLTASESVLVD